MDNTRLWNKIAWGFFISNTLGILVLVDVIFFRMPYITLFILIFSLTLYLNFKLFKKHLQKPI